MAERPWYPNEQEIEAFPALCDFKSFQRWANSQDDSCIHEFPMGVQVRMYSLCCRALVETPAGEEFGADSYQPFND